MSGWVCVSVLKNNSRSGKSNFFYFKGGAMRGDTVEESLQYTRICWAPERALIFQVLKWIYRHSLRKTRLTTHTTPTFSTLLTCQFDFMDKYMAELYSTL